MLHVHASREEELSKNARYSGNITNLRAAPKQRKTFSIFLVSEQEVEIEDAGDGH